MALACGFNFKVKVGKIVFCQRIGWMKVMNQYGSSSAHHKQKKSFCTKLMEDPNVHNEKSVLKQRIDEKSKEVELTPITHIPPRSNFDIREHFIPLTRRSTVRYLIQENNFLREDEQDKLEQLALALHGVVVGQYHGVLEELKILFDPLNPDKETAITRKVTVKEKMDMEFWLIQKLSVVMEKANFYELPKHVVDKAISEHDTREGVQVKVTPEKYAVMKFWAIGKETSATTMTQMEKVSAYLYQMNLPTPIKNIFRPLNPLKYYRRVIVAVRLKTDSKLMLKAFKEVPTGALEQLLPDGTIKMSNFDQTVLSTSIMIGSLGIFANIVTYLADIKVQWTLLVAGLTAFLAGRTWSLYKNRRNAYLVQLNKMLYFKNVANNRSLLTLLVDRAEDETFKEALLTYVFLLIQKPPSITNDVNMDVPSQIGGITQALLEKNIEAWVRTKVGSHVDFNSQESIEFLQSLGLVHIKDNKVFAIPMEMAFKLLPPVSSSIAYKTKEEDTFEGYDKDVLLDSTISQDICKSRYGWA